MFTITIGIELVILKLLLTLEEALSSVGGQCSQGEVCLVREGSHFDGGHPVHWETEDGARVDVVGWRADENL